MKKACNLLWMLATMFALLSFSSCEKEELTYTVIINPSQNGTISVSSNGTSITSGTKIKVGSEIKVSTTPNDGYELATLNVDSIFTLSNNVSIVATFAKLYTVSIQTTTNGTVTVKNGTKVITNGTRLSKGTSLTITTTPADNYWIDSLNISSPFTLIQDTTIIATFKPIIRHTVTIITPTGGSLTLLHGTEEITSGMEVVENSDISLSALSDAGYVFNGFNVSPHFKLTQDTTITATFDPIATKYVIANYNIRYYNSGDTGNKAWSVRKSKLFEMIRKYNFDICGIEEMTSAQSADFVSTLTEYAYIGYGRNNGKENSNGGSGEQTGLIFKKDRYNLLDSGRIFLSNTPTVASKLASSTFNRMVTWVKLEDINTSKVFFFFATHFDNPITQTGINTRSAQADIAITQVQAIAGTDPLFFVGDFNCEPDEPAYTKLSAVWSDAYSASETPIQGGYEVNVAGSLNDILYEGEGYTYTGLYSSSDSYPKRIDYVLFSSDKITAKSYNAPNETRGLTTYPSDHLPVVTECVLKN